MPQARMQGDSGAASFSCCDSAVAEMAMQLRRDQAAETDTSRPGSQPGSTWQQWRLLLKPAEYR
jgi:hypothetical protein